MIVNSSAPPGPVVPILIYQDVSKAIDWLSGAFGFIERLRTAPEPDGTIHHAQLAVGAGAVMLTGQRDPSEAIQRVYVQVENVDGHCERAKKFGARILRPPNTCPFGERQYTAGLGWQSVDVFRVCSRCEAGGLGRSRFDDQEPAGTPAAPALVLSRNSRGRHPQVG